MDWEGVEKRGSGEMGTYREKCRVKKSKINNDQ